MADTAETFPSGIFDVPLFPVSEDEPVKSFPLASPPSACRLLILLHDQNNDTCGAADLDLLNKIADWKELKLGRNEVRVVNLAQQQTGFTVLLKNFEPQNIIGFGITPGEIRLNIDHEETTLFKFREVRFIFTAPLQKLYADDNLKNRFFREALRPMFQ